MEANMAKYQVKDVKCGVVDGGVGPCGPRINFSRLFFFFSILIFSSYD